MVYVVRPENREMLTAFSGDPRLKGVQVEQIEIDPKARSWRVSLCGPKADDQTFWTELAASLAEKISEIDTVEFVWVEEAEEAVGAEEDYMAKVLQSFQAARPENQVTPSRTTPTAAPARRKGRTRQINGTISEEPVKISHVIEEEQGVVIAGEIISVDKRETRTGKTLVTWDLYDGSDSITCKLFVDSPEQVPDLAVGGWLKVKGNAQYQSFDGEISVMVHRISPLDPPSPRMDRAAEKRVELHLHTKMSSMDGLVNTEEAIAQAAKWGHRAIAITDHGVIQAFPEAYFASQKHGIKILYGLEGYLVDGEKDRPYHVIILAQNAVGLKNLYKIVSISHLEHFYRRPRIPRSVLQEYRSGLIVGSACEAGEVYQAILQRQGNVREIAQFYDYLEIQPLANNEFMIGGEWVKSSADLKRINREIYELGRALNKPVVATGDVHFLREEDSYYRTILLAGQGYEDAERQAPLYFRTTDEMLEEFAYLGSQEALEVVVKNPQLIADSIEELTPVPQGLFPPKIPEAEEKIKEMSYSQARAIYGDPLPKQVSDRLERELRSIIGNGYAPLYWIAHKLVKKSLDDGYLVGSRGSVGSSLVATMCNITEVNPLPPHYVCPECCYSDFPEETEAGSGVDLPERLCDKCGTPMRKLGFDIPFEVFMGFHGDKVPDIDLNFSGEYQSNVHRYTEELFGSDHVFRAGTIGTLAEKTAYGFVMKYLEQTGRRKRNAEVNRLVKQITGVRRTTGQHPGGMMVVPADKEVYDFTPIQHPANDSSSGIITTHFDYHAIHDSLVKLDILGHDDPTVLRMLADLTGIDVLAIPLDDPDTMSIFSGLEALGVTEEQIGTPVGTLGIPEFGTRFVRQMLVETRPQTFSDLIRISGLSHGTNVWTNNAQELIARKVIDIGRAIACRDDIMVSLIHHGMQPGDAFRIMEQVRKGKGLSEEDVELMKGCGVPDWYIDSCNKISYMFPKAHAVAYVMMAFRIAYFKVHYPEAYYCTYFSVRAAEFDADLVVQGEGRIRQEIRDIEAKGNEATAKERNVVTILEIVLEALARGISFLPVDLYDSDHSRFRITEKGLRPPLVALQGLGSSAARNIYDARMNGEFTSIEDLRQRTRISKTVIEVLRNHGCLEGMSETNQLTLF